MSAGIMGKEPSIWRASAASFANPGQFLAGLPPLHDHGCISARRTSASQRLARDRPQFIGSARGRVSCWRPSGMERVLTDPNQRSHPANKRCRLSILDFCFTRVSTRNGKRLLEGDGGRHGRPQNIDKRPFAGLCSRSRQLSSVHIFVVYYRHEEAVRHAATARSAIVGPAEGTA